MRITCASSGTAATFENEDKAYDAGWLRVTAKPGDAADRAFWFAPGHITEWPDVMKREGLITNDMTMREVAATFVREGRVLE